MWWAIAFTSIIVAGLAGLMDRRRDRRTALDRTGWMPWGGITVAALFAFAGAVALTMH